MYVWILTEPSCPFHLFTYEHTGNARVAGKRKYGRHHQPSHPHQCRLRWRVDAMRVRNVYANTCMSPLLARGRHSYCIVVPQPSLIASTGAWTPCCRALPVKSEGDYPGVHRQGRRLHRPRPVSFLGADRTCERVWEIGPEVALNALIPGPLLSRCAMHDPRHTAAGMTPHRPA